MMAGTQKIPLHMLRRSALCLCLSAIVKVASAQFVIGPGTSINASSNTPIAIVISGDVINSTSYDFNGPKVSLTLTGTDPQQIEGDWVLKGLFLRGQSLKTLHGNLFITDSMSFEEGILHAQSHRVEYAGPANTLFVSNLDTEASYIDGPFYQRGDGKRTYPIGKNGLYAPLVFIDSELPSSEVIGVEVFDENPNLPTDEPRIIATDQAKYYRIDGNVAGIKSRVSIRHNNAQFADPQTSVGTIVIEASQTEMLPTSLGGIDKDEVMVTSKQPLTSPVLAVGLSQEVEVKIRDLITPFGSTDTNDMLFVQNVGLFQNTVTLLDRWGVVVKEWKNYNNITNDFDFRKLTPGNYICIVEYTEDGVTKKVSQMVTVLKTN
jgi:hypothetical protein